MSLCFGSRVIHRRSDTRISDGPLDRTRKLGGVILYPGRSTINANSLVYRSGSVAKLYRRNTSGRCYVTSDVSIDRRTAQIFPSGERLATSSNMRRKSDSSTLECTKRRRSFQGQLRARQESLPVLA